MALPSGGDAAAGGRRGAFPSPAGRFACFPRAKPGCMVLPPAGGIQNGAARRCTSPAERYYITPWTGRPSNRPEGEADPGQNPWRPGPQARRRHQPSARRAVNLREYGKHRHLSPRPVASNIAHSKKAPVIRLVLFQVNQQLPILPGRFQPSTFGVCELNYRVRHGYGCILTAIATESLRVCTLKTV